MNMSEAGMDPFLRAKRNQILSIAKQHGATSVKVFGSMARGNALPQSDVDLLVELEEGRTLIDLGALLMDLQDLLGRKVDLTTPNGLHHLLKDRILQEATPL
jgi:hypothetical protein